MQRAWIQTRDGRFRKMRTSIIKIIFFDFELIVKKFNIAFLCVFLFIANIAMGADSADLTKSILTAGTFESYDDQTKIMVFKDNKCQKNISLKVHPSLLGVEKYYKGQQVKVHFTGGVAYGLILATASSNPISNYQCEDLRFYTSSDAGIGDAKAKCKDLGFKIGTDEFGKCVLQLSK